MGGSTLKTARPHRPGKEAMWLAQGSMSCCSECSTICHGVSYGSICPGCRLRFVTAGPVTDTIGNWRAVERFGADHFELPLQAELEAAKQAHHLPRMRRRHWPVSVLGALLFCAMVFGILWLINISTNPVTCEGQQTVQLTAAQLERAHGSNMGLTEAVAADELPSPGYDLFEVARIIDQMNPDLDAAKAKAGNNIVIPTHCGRRSDP